MACFSPSYDSSKGHRHLYKATTPPWRESLRTRCFARFRKARERLIDTFRHLPVNTEKTANDLNLVDEVIKEEWNELQQEEFYNVDKYKLYEMLEEEIRQELKDEERQLVQWYEEFHHAEMNAMVDELDKVLCPVCKKSYLQELNGFITCNCGVNISSEGQSNVLQYLQKVIADGITLHGEFCENEPVFSLESDPYFDVNQILLNCWSCNFRLKLYPPSAIG